MFEVAAVNRLDKIKKLNAHLLAEMPDLQVEEIPDTLAEQRKLLRALMNVRPPMPLDENFLKLQDEILSAEVEERGVVKLSEIPGKNIRLWQGDITRLEVDAIVNAANSACTLALTTRYIRRQVCNFATLAKKLCKAIQNRQARRK